MLLAPAHPTVFATATVGARPVATGQLVIDDGWGGIQCMTTLPAHRRSGAATAVLHALAGAAAHAQVEHLYHAVLVENDAARRLYEGVGFTANHEYSYWSPAPTSRLRR